MVTLRSRAPDDLNMPGEKTSAHKISEYELSREERIRENRERMQKLGIVDLSLKLKELKPTPKRSYHRKTPQGHSPLPPPGPVRRSSRLQNSTPVSYCEVIVTKKEKSVNEDDLLREKGSKPEIYTEEHEKLLGSTERSWTLFVDGYGKDGRRIYDPVRGKTCHQCRQKTLGHRTHCSKCNLVQGQFCGDCLYMRYGENVLEANENPNWICPVCRGICNCSLCRQAKGWPPTGTLYRKISSLGYKSVAHYLIQTQRANTDPLSTKVPVSAKRSLPFSEIEATMGQDDLCKASSGNLNTSPLSESNKKIDESKMAPESGEEPLLEPAGAIQLKDEVEKDEAAYDEDKEAESLAGGGLYNVPVELKPLNDPLHTEPRNYNEGLISETLVRGVGDDDEFMKEKNRVVEEKDFVTTETSLPKSSKKRVLPEPSPDSIAGRLRQRRSETNTSEEGLELVNANYSTIADADSIGRRLKMRRRV